MAMSKLHKLSNRCDRMRRSSHRTEADYRQYRMSRRGLRDARFLESRLVEIPSLSNRTLFIEKEIPGGLILRSLKIDAPASVNENRPEPGPSESNAAESKVTAANDIDVLEAFASNIETADERKKRLKRERDARYRAAKKNKSSESAS